MSSRPIVCAMSGGVDSSVAAYLLRQAGQDVIGVSMQVWDYRQNGGCRSKATCCSPDDFTDARVAAARIGIPYYVFDFERTFRKEVIDRFVDTYKRGQTPNPCIDCNSKVKFHELRQRAASFGCDAVATGHYAQIEQREDGPHLIRGADPDKDQSYFLYGIKTEELAQTVFPVGAMKKAEVRQIAAEAGLPTAQKPESQDICFVSGSLSDFLIKIGGKGVAGPLLGTNGEVLGQHEGIHSFTVGQRRGLGISGTEEPHYVVEIDPSRNAVVIGGKSDLDREDFFVGEISWVNPQIRDLFEKGQAYAELECIAQLRSRHKGARVKVRMTPSGLAHVYFAESSAVVSPGQAAVFYDLDNREVFGGGRIMHGKPTAEQINIPHTSVVEINQSE